MSRGPQKSKEALKAEARDRERYAMKRSEFRPSLNCRGCGRSIPEHWIPGRGPVCSDCLPLFDVDGRATPAEPGTTAEGQAAQLALFQSQEEEINEQV